MVASASAATPLANNLPGCSPKRVCVRRILILGGSGSVDEEEDLASFSFDGGEGVVVSLGRMA